MKREDLSNVWVIIAAYNEAKVIAKTVSSVIGYVKNVIVVDDCSIDMTSQIARESGAHVLSHPINLGQGAALQTGIQYAMQMGAEYIITFDGDGQHQVSEMLPMLFALQNSSAEIALGSRFLGKTLNLP